MAMLGDGFLVLVLVRPRTGPGTLAPVPLVLSPIGMAFPPAVRGHYTAL